MRRQDREVTDPTEIEDIIKACDCCRLGFYDNGEVYIVPLSFAYEIIDQQYIFYFHGAKAGRKFELLKESPRVAFEMDTNYKVVIIDTKCRYTAQFQSVMGQGTATLVLEDNEYDRCFKLFLNQTTKETDWIFPPHLKKVTSLFKVVVDTISCKEKF